MDNELPTIQFWYYLGKKTVYLKTDMYAKCKIQFFIPAFPHLLKQLVKTTRNSKHTKAQSTLNRVKGNTRTSS